MKIFVSHAHEDASLLSEIKENFLGYGITLFLAHEDINIGEHDLDTIRQEIEGCDVFLTIGNKLSRESEFCNQEIGLALGYKKEIISIIAYDTEPWGFIARQQAIRYKSLDDDDMFIILFNEILNFAPPSSAFRKKKQYLDALGFSCFSVDMNLKNAIKNAINLKSDDNWNDYGYYTIFNINEKFKVFVRIGFSGQKKRQKTKDHLPKIFPFLSDKFFSRITFLPPISDVEKEALSILLNDVESNLDLTKTIINEEVLDFSLYRDKPDEYNQLKKKCNSESESK